jgi:hypothetical protein
MVALSRSVSLKTGFQDPVHASWPASEHPEHLNTTIINRRRFLDRLRLESRWHAIQQHLFERPDAISQARRHRWRLGVPHLGRAHSIGSNRFGERLAKAGMMQDEKQHLRNLTDSPGFSGKISSY